MLKKNDIEHEQWEDVTVTDCTEPCSGSLLPERQAQSQPWCISIYEADYRQIENAMVKVYKEDTVRDVIMRYFGEYYDISYYRFGKIIDGRFFEYEINEFDIKTLSQDPKINCMIDIVEK